MPVQDRMFSDELCYREDGNCTTANLLLLPSFGDLARVAVAAWDAVFGGGAAPAASEVIAIEGGALQANGALQGALLRQALNAEQVAGAQLPTALTGYTRHGLNQAISRDGVGVSVAAIRDAFQNPLSIAGQVGGKFEFVGRYATIILNDAGQVITTWARNASGWRFAP